MSYYSLCPTHAVTMYLPLMFVRYRDELEWILRDILWERCKHKPDNAFETIARYNNKIVTNTILTQPAATNN